MKVVVLHGVGFFKDNPPNKLLLKELKKIPNSEIVWYNWQHKSDLPSTKGLDYKLIRDFSSEVILDFQTVVKYAYNIPVPDADYYIGHSAGSILALIQPKPCIIFGSPACLVDDIQGVSAVDSLISGYPVLNIIHKKDVLAFPFKFANNYIVNTNWWELASWNPVSAHTCYWDDKEIVQKIVSTLKEWDLTV
jgi:hypothetical protein